VGRIALVSTATDTVCRQRGRGSSSKQEQFKVYDVFNPTGENIPINFTLTQTVNGGEYLIAPLCVSDTNGNVSTTFKSGIRSGTVQLVAQAKQDSANINFVGRQVNLYKDRSYSIYRAYKCFHSAAFNPECWRTETASINI